MERCVTYARQDGSGWLRDPYKSRHLHQVLSERAYQSPLQDGDVPWGDPDDNDTYNFYGVFPLSVDGIDDSTRTSTITENIGDGGNAGRIRHGTRQMVFNTLLLGQDDAAVNAGMNWLRQALTTSDCEGKRGCEGTDLCFFAAEPPWQANRGDCGEEYLRTIKNVTVTTGPTITAKNIMSDGASVWTVTWTATAAIPWHYGLPVNVVRQLPNPHKMTHIAGSEPEIRGYGYHEGPCKPRHYGPVWDPACPDLVLPPDVPQPDLGCYTPPKAWRRYRFKIPAYLVPAWTDVVPYIQVHTGTDPLRNMRIRLYADPHGNFQPDGHPCQYCADFVISYCPDSATLEIDGRLETVTVYTRGQARRGDGLVFGTDGMPFVWPSLSCGIGYVVTVDMLMTATQTQNWKRRSVLDFSVVPRFR